MKSVNLDERLIRDEKVIYSKTGKPFYRNTLKGDTVTLTLRLSNELYRRVVEYCDSLGLSIEELIYHLIKTELDGPIQTKEAPNN